MSLVVGVKALRLELVHHVERAALNTREASTVGRGVGTGITLGGEDEDATAGSHSGEPGPTDGGEEEHEREDEERGEEQDGGSDEEEEDEEREDDDVMVTGEEEAVQFAGEKVADKSGGSGPKSGKKAWGSGGSTTTRMVSKAGIERMKAAERENKKLREEKLVAEKRLEFQTARIDTLFGVVTSALNKLTTVADSVTSHEQTSGRSLQTAVAAMREVVQEAVHYRGSTLEFMNAKWLPTVQALHLTASAANTRRREDDVLLLRGVADALGEKIKTAVSAEVKAAMESKAQGIAAAVTSKVVQELRDDLVKAVTSATQQGLGTAGFSFLPTALASVDDVLQDPASVVGKIGGQPLGDKQPQAATDPPSAHDMPPSCDRANLADELLGRVSVVGKKGWQLLANQHPQPEASPTIAQGARPSGGMAQMADELLHLAAVVGQPRGEPVAGQHVQPSTSTAIARPTGVTPQLADDLLRPAAVVGQQGEQPVAGQHLHPSTSTATAQDARPGGRHGIPGRRALAPSSGDRKACRASRGGPASPYRDESGEVRKPRIFLRHPATRRSTEEQRQRTSRRRLQGRGSQQRRRLFGEWWKRPAGAGGVDPEILASIVMPDPEIKVMREKLKAAAPTVGAQQGTPAASSTLGEDPSATGAKSPSATTGEVGDGKQTRKGKAKPGPSKATSKAVMQGRKGLGVRVDKETGLATSEMNFGKKSRYICQSMDKSEAAYYIAVTVSSFDGYVSDLILAEFVGVKEDVMEQYKSDWNVVRLISGDMWTIMFQEVVAEYNRITAADRAALMVALRPAVWFGDLPESTKPEKAAKNMVASDMITRALMCAAFAPVAAKVTPIPGVESERLSEILAGTACAVWCFSETNASAEAAAGEGGAATTVRGASSEFASRCKSVIEVVLQRASSGEVVVGEVVGMVTKDLQGAVLRSLPEDGDERDHDELIACVMFENLAFWGDCCVGGPKLKARGIVLPIDADMKTIVRNRGARGQHKGKQATNA
ncbi:unnamed protein product [Closterium sp. NIES-64]|nr:unnamed protein product [Closterium sp. NIES-64]